MSYGEKLNRPRRAANGPSFNQSAFQRVRYRRKRLGGVCGFGYKRASRGPLWIGRVTFCEFV